MYSEIAANKRKTFYIFAFFIVLVGGLAALVSRIYTGGFYITPFAVGGAAIYALITYYAGSKMATAVNGAKEIEKRDNPRLYNIVENLAITNGMPMPKVYIMDDPSPNAFATGRDPNHAIVCATTGLMEIMDDKELQGVMAHEMGHVKNYDIRVSMIAFALVSVISVIADMIMYSFWFRGGDSDSKNNSLFFVIGIIAAIIAPIVAAMIQMAISRRREYLADASGALTTRYPEGLASALEKIGQYGSSTQKQNTSTAHLFFANPLSKGAMMNLFSTHPPIEDRVARLRAMGDKV